MARTTQLSGFFFLFVFFLVSMPEHSQASSNSQLKTLLSSAHPLAVRVANLSASLGDQSGSLRASLKAEKLERGLGLVWSHGWDCAKNYAWRDLTYSELYGAVSASNELLKGLVDLARMNSDAQTEARISRNYQNIFRSANSISRRLFKVFIRSGPWREAVEIIQMAVVEGGLLKDYLELGSNDLKGQPTSEFVRADIESLSNRVHQIEVTMTEHHREVMEYLREMMEYHRGTRQIIQDLVEANDDDVRPMSGDDDDYAEPIVGR